MPSNNAINNELKVTSYTTPGTYSWTINPRTSVVEVWTIGGGAGGGSGRQGLTLASGGGGGGGGGAISYAKLFSSNITSPVTVTVAAGVNGGSTQSSASTNGNPGTNGNSSSFGSYIISTGGEAGPGGSTSSVGPAPGGTGNFNGREGEQGATGSGVSAEVSSFYTATYGGGAGGGGGGSGAYSISALQAGNGSNIIWADGGATLLTGGAGGIETGTINGGIGPSASSISPNIPFYMIGAGGGGGGGQHVGGSAGSGGNGGTPGGGGGGGGGSLNGTSSGIGGTGAAGAVYVVEYFG